MAEPDARSVCEVVSELLKNPIICDQLSTLQEAFTNRNSWPLFMVRLNNLSGIRARIT